MQHLILLATCLRISKRSIWSANGQQLTIDFLEHGRHALKIAVVQEPDVRISIILLKGDCRAHIKLLMGVLIRTGVYNHGQSALACEAVCDIYSAFVCFPKQDTNYAFLGVLGNSVVVIYYGQQNEGMHDYEVVCWHRDYRGWLPTAKGCWSSKHCLATRQAQKETA